MRNLSFILIVLIAAVSLRAQSPHGKDFKIDCSNCHTSENWKVIPAEIKFDHDSTPFKLTGQHKNVSCADCHKSLVFSEAVDDCGSCHKSVHQNSVSPVCSNCHTTQNWLVANINDIHRMSRFPLIGVHAFQDCAQCHQNYASLNFEVRGIECIDCHRANYQSTSNPNHMQAGFSTDCTQCHEINQAGWGLSNFVHEFFPLVGGHNIKDCFSCHRGKKFTGLSKDCYSCHRQTYEATTNPNHMKGNFGTDCASCHTINGWRPANFDHNITGFPLIGRHKTAGCNSCHSSGYTNLPVECYSCHKADYDKAVNPNHVANNFPVTCEQCHDPNGWSPSTFDHNATAFPLTGAHVSLNCSSCHSAGYTNISADCYSCHKSNYDGTTDPNHVASGFPTDCKQCHTTTAWKPANFDHSTTAFPLTGAHTTVTCTQCHTSGYAGTPTDCYACHRTNYDNTTNPNHAAANFPTACVQCHTTNGWTPSTFDHDSQYFPIYSGNHAGKWNSCSDCHTNQSNYASHTCNAVCHKSDHNQNQDCYSCHPRGTE